MRRSTIIGLVLALAFGGCAKQTPTVIPAEQVVIEQPKDAKKVLPTDKQGSFEIGQSVEGQPIKVNIIGQGGDVIFMLAAVHGDEQAGTLLINELERYLDENREIVQGKKVILLSPANPDGVKSNSRYNARSVDINRNFSAPNRQDKEQSGPSANSEPETQVIVRIIDELKPNRIISIQESSQCIDYDGPAKELAKHIEKFCDLRVRKIGAMPGSLGSYAGNTLNIPVITFALHKKARKIEEGEQLWKHYGDALVAAIIYPDEPKQEGKDKKSKDKKKKDEEQKFKDKKTKKSREEDPKAKEEREAKNNFESQVRDAIALYTKGEHIAAKKKFESLLNSNSECQTCREYIEKCDAAYLELHYGNGVRYFEKNQFSEAVREWELVQKTDPNYKNVKENISMAKQLSEKKK